MRSLTQKQYDQIADVLPVQRGNVEIENLVFLNAVFYVAEKRRLAASPRNVAEKTQYDS